MSRHGAVDLLYPVLLAVLGWQANRRFRLFDQAVWLTILRLLHADRALLFFNQIADELRILRVRHMRRTAC